MPRAHHQRGLRLPAQSRRNGSSVVADEPTFTFGAVSGFAYLPFQISNSVSSPRLSAPARNSSNVTEYSPGGAPSMGAAVLRTKRPSLPVSPFGVNCMLNLGWRVTFTPAAGLPL